MSGLLRSVQEKLACEPWEAQGREGSRLEVPAWWEASVRLGRGGDESSKG